MDYTKLPFLQKLHLADVQDAMYKVMTSDIEQAKVLYQYSVKFLMIPDYWLDLLTLLRNITNDEKTLNSCRILALSQFYSNEYGNEDDKHVEWYGCRGIIAKCRTYDTYPEGIAMLEEALTFPHHFLQRCYSAYETLSAKPITKDLQEKYNQAVKLFNILKTSTFDDEWFKALMAINNDKVIITNFEYFLGINFSCVALWKAYINYMKPKNSIALLNIYRRYNRFFIGDFKMIEEYLKEIERIGLIEDVTDFWEDTIEFELEFCGLKYAQEIFDRALLATLKKDFLGHPLGADIVEYCEGFKAHRSLYPRGKTGADGILEFKKAVGKWKEMCEKKYSKKKGGKGAATVSTGSDKVSPGSTTSSNSSATVPRDSSTVSSTPTTNSTDTTTVSKSVTVPPSTTLTPKLNPSTIQKQSFSIPFSYIYQILKSATPETLTKLFHSCKSLFKLHSTPLCYQLGVNDEVKPQYFQQSLFIPVSQIAFPGLQKLHIVNSLDFIVETDRKALSKLIPLIHKCSAKFIHIDSQDLTIDEFKFITANMQILHICNTKVLDFDGRELTNEEISALADGIFRFDNAHW